jgi:hypothetical protein
MGKCPTCGTSYLFSTPSETCNWCGKVVCVKCLPQWSDSLQVKSTMENGLDEAKYKYVHFCSKSCSDIFWNTVAKYPLDEIGTDIANFGMNLRKLLYSAILNALNFDVNLRVDAINKVERAIEIETEDYAAILVGLLDDGSLQSDVRVEIAEFVKRGYSTLALNLEKCGRPQDAAEIYEKKLKMYDKARLLRINDKQVIVKQTDVSINLNELLKQVKDGGIVAIYRCPHCNGTLKVNDKTSLKSLKTCEHCGSEIETLELADFLKTALS